MRESKVPAFIRAVIRVLLVLDDIVQNCNAGMCQYEVLWDAMLENSRVRIFSLISGVSWMLNDNAGEIMRQGEVMLACLSAGDLGKPCEMVLVVLMPFHPCAGNTCRVVLQNNWSFTAVLHLK